MDLNLFLIWVNILSFWQIKNQTFFRQDSQNYYPTGCPKKVSDFQIWMNPKILHVSEQVRYFWKAQSCNVLKNLLLIEFDDL